MLTVTHRNAREVLGDPIEWCKARKLDGNKIHTLWIFPWLRLVVAFQYDEDIEGRRVMSRDVGIVASKLPSIRRLRKENQWPTTG